MRTSLGVLFLFALFSGGGIRSAWCQPEGRIVGNPVPDAGLTDLQRTPRSLKSHSGRVVVLVFWSFKCPVSLAYNDEVGRVAAKYREQGVDVIGVAPGGAESAPEIRRNAANLKLGFELLLDVDGLLAGRLGVTQVPAVFVVDQKGIVRYSGAWDDNRRLGAGRRTSYAEPAIEAVISGRDVVPAETQPFGCTLQRR